jgi:hypothetical protein
VSCRCSLGPVSGDRTGAAHGLRRERPSWQQLVGDTSPTMD